MQAVLQPTEPVAPAQAGASHPIGATLTPDGVNVSVYAKRATAIELLLFDRVDDDVPARVVGPGYRSASDGALLARLRAGRPGRAGLRLPGARPVGAGARPAVRRRPRSSSTRTGEAWPCPIGYRRTAGSRASTAEGRRPAGDEERGRGPRVVRLGGRPAAGPAVRRHGDLRGPRPRLHGQPQPRRATRRAAGPTPGSSRRSRTSSTSGSPRSSCCRSTSSTPQEAPGGPELLGLPARVLLRPHGAYASRPGAQAAVDEFRDLVKALHRAGLEVILDVVYNHTAESGDDGPTFATGASPTTSTTSSIRRTARATPTTRAAATRSTPTSPSCVG